MTIKQLESKKWQVNIQPGGRGASRLKKSFATKAEALAWERHIRTKVQQEPEWSPPKKDGRKLTELCDIWFHHHGSGLKAGNDTHRRLLAMCEAMGNPMADTFSADVFAAYRTKRISDGITPSNMNREQSYLRAVFNELSRLGHWTKENPLTNIRAFKIQEIERKYLDGKQIVILMQELKASKNPHVELISRICLSTHPITHIFHNA